MKAPECVDCIAEGVTRYRPTPHGGLRTPLCVTHNRSRKRKRSARTHELRLGKVYGITAEDYQAVCRMQAGTCFICRRAKGISKRLAVDHDHDRAEFECGHERDMACRNCIRALLCGQCNELVGRYDVEALGRAITVIVGRPAQRVLNPPKPRISLRNYLD